MGTFDNLTDAEKTTEAAAMLVELATAARKMSDVFLTLAVAFVGRANKPK